MLKLLMKMLLKETENISWDEILEIENKNVNRSFNELLPFHAPIQKMSKDVFLKVYQNRLILVNFSESYF